MLATRFVVASARRKSWCVFTFQVAIISLAMLFSEACAFWFKSKIKSVRPQSYDRYEVTFKRYFKTEILDKDIIQINEREVVRYLQQLDSASPLTHRQYAAIMQIFRGAFTVAFYNGIDCRCDFSLVSRLFEARSDAKGSVRNVSSADRELLFSADVNDPLCLMILKMNFFLGLRIGELAVLKWSDFDFDKKLLRVHGTSCKYYLRDEDGNRIRLVYGSSSGKSGNAVRVVPLSDQCIRICLDILKYKQLHGIVSDFVCDNGSGRVNSLALDRCLRDAVRKAGIDHFSSHSIRRSYATDLHEANIPTRMISDCLGHADISTTEKYYIGSSSDYLDVVRAALDKL